MLGKTFFLKINLKYYFFPPKPKEDILIARDILYAPTVLELEDRIRIDCFSRVTIKEPKLANSQ
jgi:hypothetical protein